MADWKAMQTGLFQHTNPLPSVPILKVAKVLNPGEGLMRWANKIGLEGKTMDEVRKGSTGAGNVTHHALKALAEDRPIDVGGLDPVQKHYVVELVNWFRSRAVRALHTETVVKSERYRFHGRLDLIRACDAPGCCCYGEGGVLVDVKTGTRSPYPEHHLQIAGYRLGWVETALMPRHLCGAEVLGIPKHGSAEVHASDMPTDAFLSALALYRFVDAARDGREMGQDELALVRESALR